jgi:hypothetical protein
MRMSPATSPRSSAGCSITTTIFARELFHGDGEEGSEALEIWMIDGWLAGQLKRRGERVGQLWVQDYWARCATGQAIYLDTVIQEIAKATTPRE